DAPLDACHGQLRAGARWLPDPQPRHHLPSCRGEAPAGPARPARPPARTGYRM
ncbi:MAG: hypothetical protein AVDCRST_MAG27-202, partial [uncultured Craurococcus sp.]